MQLSNFNLDVCLRVTNIDPATSEEQWDKFLTLSETNGSKITKGFGDLYFFDFPNGRVFGQNIQEDLAITDVLIGLGDGTETHFTKDYAVEPAKPNSVSIVYTIGGTQYTATDDGSGNITGTHISSATIDYPTNAVDITFDTAPDSGTAILENFTRGITADDTLTSGYTFYLATDSNPTLSDDFFTSTIALSPTLSSVDWYEQENNYVFRATMTASYTSGTDSPKVTGVDLAYTAITGDASGTNEQTKLIFKSTVPNTTTLFGSNGLILTNQTNLKLEFCMYIKK